MGEHNTQGTSVFNPFS